MCSESASEANLTECTLFDACTSTCNSSTVGIQCYGNCGMHVCMKRAKTGRFLFTLYLLYITTEPGECYEGAVQLENGGISQEGRVEVCLGGVWGSVCGESWDKTDAYFVCQQLKLGKGGQN